MISDLTAKSYYCLRNKRSQVYTGIEAIKEMKVTLVHVKTAVHPAAPDSLSTEETTRIKNRAIRMGCSRLMAVGSENRERYVKRRAHSGAGRPFSIA